MPYRFHPTPARAADLREALAAVGCRARVARQRTAFRIVVANAAERDLAAAAAVMSGFGGPVGGPPVRNAHVELFVYDWRGEAA